MGSRASFIRRIAAPAVLALVSPVLLAMPGRVATAVPDNVNLAPDRAVVRVAATQLQSPLPGAAVSSEFGGRRHPVLKRVRFHGGLDFAARIGTPVLAAGAGVVERMGRTRERGLYVVIRHGERLLSGYAHLSRFSRGLRTGQRVAAQQIIGAVGRSGRAAGSHLHFEVLVDEQRVDPRLALTLPRLDQTTLGARSTPRFSAHPTVADGMG